MDNVPDDYSRYVSLFGDIFVKAFNNFYRIAYQPDPEKAYVLYRPYNSQEPNKQKNDIAWATRKAQKVTTHYLKTRILDCPPEHLVVLLQVYLRSRDGDDDNETLDRSYRVLAQECLDKLKTMVNIVSYEMLVQALRVFCKADSLGHDKHLQTSMARGLSSRPDIEEFMRWSGYKKLLNPKWRYSGSMLELLSKAVAAGGGRRYFAQDDESIGEDGGWRRRRSGL